MRIANLNGRASLLLDDERAIDLHDASGGVLGHDPQELWARWDVARRWVDEHEPGPGGPVDGAVYDAPVPRPRQVFAIGLNYAAHAAEAGVAPPGAPSVFTKFATSITGPDATVVLPSDHVDWEVELVAVVGREAHQVDEADAWDHIAGLTIGQDLSERQVQNRPPMPQFSLGKSFPGFGPIGPVVVTADELADPDDLALSCSVNGETVQSARTSDLVFSVPALVARLSAVVRLLPGDLVFTGTPSGIGLTRTPPRFLKPGDELVSSIEGIGTLRTHLVAGASAGPDGASEVVSTWT